MAEDVKKLHFTDIKRKTLAVNEPIRRENKNHIDASFVNAHIVIGLNEKKMPNSYDSKKKSEEVIL